MERSLEEQSGKFWQGRAREWKHRGHPSQAAGFKPRACFLMHPFATYVLRTYYKATGWNEDNLYANFTRSSNGMHNAHRTLDENTE